jgi:hypothetical protein
MNINIDTKSVRCSCLYHVSTNLVARYWWWHIRGSISYWSICVQPHLVVVIIFEPVITWGKIDQLWDQPNWDKNSPSSRLKHFFTIAVGFVPASKFAMYHGDRFFHSISQLSTRKRQLEKISMSLAAGPSFHMPCTTITTEKSTTTGATRIVFPMDVMVIFRLLLVMSHIV